MADRSKRRSPRRGTRNRKPSESRALATAKRLARQFHGTVKGQIVTLTERERRLPKHAVRVGALEDLTYRPSAGSKRGGWRWRHESGDRGLGRQRSANKPVVAVDPKTKRAFIVPGRSPMRFSARRGLVG